MLSKVQFFYTEPLTLNEDLDKFSRRAALRFLHLETVSLAFSRSPFVIRRNLSHPRQSRVLF